mgnify:CR=1 FL=1
MTSTPLSLSARRTISAGRAGIGRSRELVPACPISASRSRRTVPNSVALLNLQLYTQALSVDTVNTLGGVVSDAAALIIGQ